MRPFGCPALGDRATAKSPSSRPSARTGVAGQEASRDGEDVSAAPSFAIEGPEEATVVAGLSRKEGRGEESSSIDVLREQATNPTAKSRSRPAWRPSFRLFRPEFRLSIVTLPAASARPARRSRVQRQPPVFLKMAEVVGVEVETGRVG